MTVTSHPHGYVIVFCILFSFLVVSGSNNPAVKNFNDIYVFPYPLQFGKSYSGTSPSIKGMRNINQTSLIFYKFHGFLRREAGRNGFLQKKTYNFTMRGFNLFSRNKFYITTSPGFKYSIHIIMVCKGKSIQTSLLQCFDYSIYRH